MMAQSRAETPMIRSIDVEQKKRGLVSVECKSSCVVFCPGRSLSDAKGFFVHDPTNAMAKEDQDERRRQCQTEYSSNAGQKQVDEGDFNGDVAVPDQQSHACNKLVDDGERFNRKSMDATGTAREVIE